MPVVSEHATPHFLNNTQAAAYLNLSPRKLDEQRGIDGGPRFRKFGRRVFYARVDLVAWADEHRLRSQSRVSHNCLGLRPIRMSASGVILTSQQLVHNNTQTNKVKHHRKTNDV